MAEIYYTPSTEELALNFSAWTAIANNSISYGKNILNIFANTINELKEKTDLIDKQWRITEADISEIDHSWAISAKTIMDTASPIAVADMLSEVYLASGFVPNFAYTSSGYVASGLIPIPIVSIGKEEDFYKALPTSFVVKEIFSGNSDDNYGPCEYLNGIMRIKYKDYYTEQIIQFNRDIDPYNKNVQQTLVSVDFDPSYSGAYQYDIGYVNKNTNIRIPSQYINDTMLVFKAIDDSTIYPESTSGFLLPSTVTSIPSGIVTIPDGYVCVGYKNQCSYITATKPRLTNTGVYRADYDFDSDGVINLVELNMIQSVLDISESDVSEDDWNNIYSKYDLDGDKVITSDDVAILKKYLNSYADDTRDMVTINVPGNYLIQYETSSQPGVTGYVTSNNAILLWRNKSFDGSIKTTYGDNFVDIDYDFDSDQFLLLDDVEKCVYVMLFDENQSVVDKFKILLPIESVDEVLGGITYCGKGIAYVCSFNKFGNGYLYRINLRSSDIDANVSRVPIYLGINDEFLYTTNGGLSLGQSGLTAFCGYNKLLMTARNKVYMLEPRYDVMIVSGDKVHFRSKYNKVIVGNGSITKYAKQFWNHVWNEFDEFAWKVGLQRLAGETNLELKLRSLDVYENYPVPSEQGYINGILREVGGELFVVKQTRSFAVEHNITVSDTYPVNITIGYKVPRQLIVNRYETVPVYNTNNTVLYNKYLAYGNNTLTGEDNVLLFTVDGSTILLNFDIINPYEELMTIDYFYTEDNLIYGSGKQYVISPFKPTTSPHLELFRITDYERLSENTYGYYENDKPTNKLLAVVASLKQIDNTTFNHFVANESRFDSGSKYIFGKTSIPQYWQE